MITVYKQFEVTPQLARDWPSLLDDIEDIELEVHDGHFGDSKVSEANIRREKASFGLWIFLAPSFKCLGEVGVREARADNFDLHIAIAAKPWIFRKQSWNLAIEFADEIGRRLQQNGAILVLYEGQLP